MADSFKNRCVVVISGTLTSGATSITLVAGEGAKCPTPAPYNGMIWNSSYAAPHLDPLAETIRVTARATDVLTVARGQEGDTAVAHDVAGAVYKIAFGPTAATMIECVTVPGFNVMGAGFNALGNETGNDGPAIQAAIDAANAQGYGKVFLPPGKSFRTTQTIIIPITARNLTLEMRGAKIKGAVNGPILQIADLTTQNDRAENIELLGGVIDGPGASDGTLTAQNGINIYAVIGLFIRGTKFTNIPNIGVYGEKSAQTGSKYWNKVLFDQMHVRFIGKGGIQVGTAGAAPDDLQIYGGLFNNLGQRLTTEPGGADAGVFLSCASLSWIGSEISAVRNQNGTQGYIRAAIVRKCSGLIGGIHFEDNCNDQAASYDLLLDTDANGLQVIGISHNCGSVTSARNGVRTTSKDNLISGLYHNASVDHKFTSLLDVGGAANPIVGSLTSNGTDPTNWITYSAASDNPSGFLRGAFLLNRQYIEGYEMTAPGAPPANGWRWWGEDNGSGKTRIMVRFGTGAAVQVAIEP